MKTTQQYIDAIKLRHNVDSDYAVAKLLGTSKQTVSRYQLGKGAFDDLMALRAAELLGLNPLEVIAAANAERARNEEVRNTWTGLWDKLAVNFEDLLNRMGQRRGTALA
jgi:transcriptional regulator with XRE-family HTH domain